MKKYDTIVVGSGSGMNIVDNSVNNNEKVALVDKGPLGGTCLNVGCIPSKLLVAAADRIMEIQEAKKFGIHARIDRIDFPEIMKFMKEYVNPIHKDIQENLRSTQDFDFYEGEARFTDDYTLDVGGNIIKADKIFIASGSRPLIPTIKGLKESAYITNETVLNLSELPKSIGIIGGGYIAAEYAHFFSALGSEVTIIEQKERLLSNEEPEISKALLSAYKKRMKVHLNTKVTEVKDNTIIGKKEDKDVKTTVDTILVAVGRKSNADTLQVDKTGVETDNAGYIKVNGFFETNKKNIWAFGDAIGKSMFTHAANQEAAYLWHNITHGHKMKFDFDTVPHAVYSWPQIASVGLTEEEAGKKYDIMVGKARFNDVVKGSALREEDSFLKAILHNESGKILGFHIIGPYAPILIQEVVNSMDETGKILNSMHIHPSLSETIQKALSNAIN